MSPTARRTVVLLALALAAGVVGSGLVRLSGEVARPAVQVGAVAAKGMPAPAPAPHGRGDALPQAPVARSVGSAPWPHAAGARRPAADQVAVCGSEPLAKDQVLGLHLATPEARAMAPSLQAITTALAAGDALAQGVALALEAEAGLPTALPQPALQARLVDLALSSADPDVWMLARHACAGAPPQLPSACERLDAQALARADPGNAAPWLWMMSQAQAAHQEQAADEALYRASQSRFHDARINGLGRVLAHPVLDPQGGLPAHLVTLWLVGTQAAYDLPSYSTLMSRCAESQVADANRRLVCNDLATLLVERSREVITTAIGFRLAERLHWDAARLRAVDDLRLALQSPKLIPASATDPAGLLSCEGQGELRERLVAQAQIGERAYLAARLETLGLSLDAEARSVRARRAAASASAAQSTPP